MGGRRVGLCREPASLPVEEASPPLSCLQPQDAGQRSTVMRIGILILAAATGAGLFADQPNGQDLIDGGHFKRLRALVATRNANDPETMFLTAAVKHIWGGLDAVEKL